MGNALPTCEGSDPVVLGFARVDYGVRVGGPGNIIKNHSYSLQ